MAEETKQILYKGKRVDLGSAQMNVFTYLVEHPNIELTYSQVVADLAKGQHPVSNSNLHNILSKGLHIKLGENLVLTSGRPRKVRFVYSEGDVNFNPK